MRDTIQPLKFKINTDLSSFSLPSRVLETIGIDQYLVLYISEDKYTRNNRFESSIMYAFGNLPDLSTEISTINFSIEYRELSILYALDYMNRYAIANNTLLTLQDYLSPNSNDYATGYTVRQGILNYPQDYSGQTNKSRDTDYSVTFLELPTMYRTLVVGPYTYYVKPDGYKEVTDGNGTQLATTLVGHYLAIEKVRKGFTVDLEYREITHYQNIYNLAVNAITSGVPITVTDNLNPDGVSSRSGFILGDLDTKGGMINKPGTSTAFLPQGFSFTFYDTELSYI